MQYFYFDDNTYAAIIADIVDSKQLSDRREVQNKLKVVLEDINKKYQNSIASNFMITLGDEFQGLLNEGSQILKIINDIQLNMYPVQLRFGIGIGEINTDILLTHSIEIDGPSYNRARNMIDTIEIKKTKYEETHPNIMIQSSDENKEIDMLINELFSLSTSIKNGWTNRQVEIIKAYINCEENQYQTADFLNINQPAVSKALKKANYFSLKSAQIAIETFLSKQKEEHHV